MKSTPDEIRQRFDNDVERFSNLQTGQSATIDAPLVLELITQAAAGTNPKARDVLDVGCGAGNYTLKLLGRLPNLNCTLVDLSSPMLDRAVERISPVTSGAVRAIQGDIREVEIGQGQYDIILAAAVLHHLRTDEEWKFVFRKLHASLKPGGSIWISDFVDQATAAIRQMMWERYGDYLTGLKDSAYRNQVFAYVEKEDTPRPVMYQLDLLKEVGFGQIELLHKNNLFAAFGGIK